MVEQTITPAGITNAGSQEKPRKKLIVPYVKEAIALTLWVYGFIKLFVYDIDLLMINRVPWLQRLYPFKFFLFLGLVALVWLTLGTKRAVLRLFGFIAAYPLVLIWRVIKHAFKNWALLIVFAPAIESIVLKIKWRFILGSFTIIAALGICLTSRPPILVGFMVFLLVYLLYHYILRIRVAFRPASIFADIAATIEGMSRSLTKTYRTKEFNARSGPDAKPEDYEKKHIQNLKDLYLSNLLYENVAKKLDLAVSSRRTDVYFVVALIYSCVLTVTIFAFEYFALFKVDPSSFHSSIQPTFWAFVFFSFNTLLHANFVNMVPTSSWAITLVSLQMVTSVLIFLCLVFVLLTSSRERYRQDVNSVAVNLAKAAKEIERFIDRKLRMRLVDAEIKIIAVDPTFASVMQSLGRTPPQIEKGQEVNSPQE